MNHLPIGQSSSTPSSNGFFKFINVIKLPNSNQLFKILSQEEQFKKNKLTKISSHNLSIPLSSIDNLHKPARKRKPLNDDKRNCFIGCNFPIYTIISIIILIQSFY